MALIGARQPPYDLAAAGLNVAGLAFQGLDRRLLVDTNDQGVLRRTQVQPNDVVCLGRKLWIGTYTPRAVSPQLNAFFAQYAPYRVIGDAQCLRQRAAISTR